MNEKQIQELLDSACKLSALLKALKGDAKEETPAAAPVRIVVLQRGWAAVGYFSKSGDQCRLDKASIIRRWGTTKGLGEIAEGGPTKDTILDPCNLPVRFHELTVVLSIDCEEGKWASKLK